MGHHGIPGILLRPSGDRIRDIVLSVYHWRAVFVTVSTSAVFARTRANFDRNRLSEVGRVPRGCPQPARNSIGRIWDRQMALRARVWTMSRFPGRHRSRKNVTSSKAEPCVPFVQAKSGRSKFAPAISVAALCGRLGWMRGRDQRHTTGMPHERVHLCILHRPVLVSDSRPALGAW